MSRQHETSADNVLFNLYLLTTRLLGLFLYYNYVKGYPIKIKGDITDQAIKDIYSTGYIIAKTIAIKEVMEKLRDIPIELFYETEYEEIIDREIRGLIDLPKTIKLLACGRLLIASINQKRKYETPEMILLSNIVYEIREIARELEDQAKSNNQLLRHALSIVIRELKNSIIKVSWIIELVGLTEKKDYESLLELCDKVIDRGIYGYYHVARSFKKYIMTIKAINNYLRQYKRKKETKQLLAVEFDKVFELYSYYLIAYSLLKKLSSKELIDIIIDHESSYIGIIISRNGGLLEYRIYHDKSFEDKSWLTSNKHDRSYGLRASRPDVTIAINQEGKEKIVFVTDAKHRLELRSVFRDLRIVLGYMNEYRVDKGAIIFNSSYANESVNRPITISENERYAAIIPLEIDLDTHEPSELDRIIEEHSELVSKFIIETIL